MGKCEMRGLSVAIAAGLIIASAQFAHSRTFAGTTCYMGECARNYIVRATIKKNGVTEILVETQFYDFKRPKTILGQPQFSTHWVSCRAGHSYIENEARIRNVQPNQEPSHATEPVDKLWSSACKRSNSHDVRERLEVEQPAGSIAMPAGSQPLRLGGAIR